MSDLLDLVVVGGGLAGASMAAEAARSGRRVVVLERSRNAEDKVCGDFLSVEALEHLGRLGVDVKAMGAVRIDRMRLAGSRGVIAEAELPFAAAGLSRRVLDEAVLAAAARSGAEVRRGITVEGLALRGMWTARIRDGVPVIADAAALATGKHDLRGWSRRPEGPLQHTGLIGYKMYCQLTETQWTALGSAVELSLFPGGYAGLQAVEGGRANLCLLIEARRMRGDACGMRGMEGWPGLLAYIERGSPHLAERLAGAKPLLPGPLAVAAIPYGFAHRRANDGLWRLGDQAAVIPSLAGDGMAIALHSGFSAGRAFAQGASATSAAAFGQTLARNVGRGVQLAVGLSRLFVEHPWMAEAARWWPGVLPTLARWTRIPDKAWRADQQGHPVSPPTLS